MDGYILEQVENEKDLGVIIDRPFCQGDIIAVEKIQRRATKLVPESKHLSYEDRLQALDIPSLSYCRQKGDMVATYKLLTNQLKIKGEHLFSMGNVTTRGHKYKLFKQHATKFVRTNAFSNRIVTDWNSFARIRCGGAFN